MKAAIAEAETRLNGCGRLLVRASGTEPLIRIMAEGDDEKLVRQLVREIAGGRKVAALRRRARLKTASAAIPLPSRRPLSGGQKVRRFTGPRNGNPEAGVGVDQVEAPAAFIVQSRPP